MATSPRPRGWPLFPRFVRVFVSCGIRPSTVRRWTRPRRWTRRRRSWGDPLVDPAASSRVTTGAATQLPHNPRSAQVNSPHPPGNGLIAACGSVSPEGSLRDPGARDPLDLPPASSGGMRHSAGGGELWRVSPPGSALPRGPRRVGPPAGARGPGRPRPRTRWRCPGCSGVVAAGHRRPCTPRSSGQREWILPVGEWRRPPPSRAGHRRGTAKQCATTPPR